MVGLDTNVWVRSIPLIAIVELELVWVLETCFQLTRDQLVQALDALLPTKERVVDRADQVMKALRVFITWSARLILPCA
jgi:predicted nucleic-acid-binding protein